MGVGRGSLKGRTGEKKGESLGKRKLRVARLEVESWRPAGGGGGGSGYEGREGGERGKGSRGRRAGGSKREGSGAEEQGGQR